MKTALPRGACGAFPLKGATPMARQSRLHGVRLVAFLPAAGAGVWK